MELSERDKKLLVFATAALILWGAVEWCYLPLQEKKQTLVRVRDLKIEQLLEMGALENRYKGLAGAGGEQGQGIKDRPASFSLFSFLDQQVGQGGIKKNVVFMKPHSVDMENSSFRIDRVKIKFSGLYMAELVDFLGRVETSDSSVVIRSLSLVRTGKEPFLLDAVIETETVMPKRAVISS